MMEIDGESKFAEMSLLFRRYFNLKLQISVNCFKKQLCIWEGNFCKGYRMRPSKLEVVIDGPISTN